MELTKLDIYLDDTREPLGEGVVWVTNFRQAARLLSTGNVESISLDYDLSYQPLCRVCLVKCSFECDCDCHSEPGTGLDVVEHMIKTNIWPLRIYIHSSSPKGRDLMFDKILLHGPYKKHDRLRMYFECP